MFDSAHAPEARAHLPLDLTLQVVKEHYYWRGMDRQITAAWRHCDLCRRARGSKRSSVVTGYASRPERPNVRWSLDVKGPLPLTPRGNRYLVGARDHFSNKHLLWATKNARGEDAVEA